METPTRKRQALTLDEKREIINFYESSSTKLTLNDLSSIFLGKWKRLIPKSTLNDIIRNREKYFDVNNIRSPGAIRLKEAEHPYLEKCLYLWFSDLSAHRLPFSDSILIEKAKIFSEEIGIEHSFKYSNGWLLRFKNRHGISAKIISGESGQLDKNDIESNRIIFQSQLAKYEPNNIFNFDETALFYRLHPNKTLATGSVSGLKLDKQRISIGLCCNATGSDKIKPFVCAKSKRPRCFGKFDPNTIVYYTHNQKAWMTCILFSDWLKYFNNLMKAQKRFVCLLLDNAAGHKVDGQYSNITIQFLPPNMTSMLQPCDAGIIKSFKVSFICVCVC
jgi:hypothetical protein